MVRHVAIIMDGNRRFSQRLLEHPSQGHEWGHKKLLEVLKWSSEAGVEELTLYAFSLQNFDRPQEEFDYLMDLFVKGCDELLSRRKEAVGKGVRVRFIGEIDRFPDEVSSRMYKVMELTRDNSDYLLNLCMAYGGREEIVSAARSLASRVASGELSVDDISMDALSSCFEVSEPDLIIRTGGEVRTSNFLLWQSWYSEWFFLDTLWPEFSKEEFFGVLEEFASRKRRFGR